MNMRRVAGLIVSALVLVAGDAGAQVKPKAPKLQLCLASNGTLVAKQKCTRFEVRMDAGTIAALSASALGPQGPAGEKGTVDPNRCVTRQGGASGVSYVAARAECAAGEFLMTHGVQTSSVHSDVISIALLYLPGQSYPTGVEYETGTNTGALSYSISVEAVCCQP